MCSSKHFKIYIPQINASLTFIFQVNGKTIKVEIVHPGFNLPHPIVRGGHSGLTNTTSTTSSTTRISAITTAWTTVPGRNVISPALRYTTPSLARRWTSLTYFSSSALTSPASPMPWVWTCPPSSPWTTTCC